MPSAPSRLPQVIQPDHIGISTAADVITEGGLVAFPTETVYGLGADATNDQAVAKIYEAKGRPQFNPLIVHVPSIDVARQYVSFTASAELLAKQFWPGSLSLVLPRRNDCPLSLLVSAGLDSVAIRVPDHPIAANLLRTSSKPIAAPSANRSGDVSPTQAEHVLHSWPTLDTLGPEVILDGGACKVGLESTVVDVTTNAATLLRPGGITKEDLSHIVGEIAVADGTPDRPQSPGMLARHYAPSTPLFLDEINARAGGALLGFGPDIQSATLNLSATGDLREAASNLFSMLRKLDAADFVSISVSPIPQDGLGHAINDRLRRAATK
jgi:L-threonylcarbamoyladenylate synthase